MRRRFWTRELGNAFEGALHLTALCLLAYFCVSQLFGRMLLNVFLAASSAVTTALAIATGFLLWRLLLVDEAPRPKNVPRAVLGWLLLVLGEFLPGRHVGITSEPSIWELLIGTLHHCTISCLWRGVCFRIAFGPGSWRQWLALGTWIALQWAGFLIYVMSGGFSYAVAHPLVMRTLLATGAFVLCVTIVLWCQDQMPTAGNGESRLVVLRTADGTVRYLAIALSVLLIFLVIAGPFGQR